MIEYYLRQEFDGSLLLFRRRLGWQIRQVLYVSLNHFRHFTPADWPPTIRSEMNATLAQDWTFHAQARHLWGAQVRAYGEERLRRDAERFGELRRLLLGACGGGQLEQRGRREFVAACVFNASQPDCSSQRAALRCILYAYDLCHGRDPEAGSARLRARAAHICPRVRSLTRAIAPARTARTVTDPALAADRGPNHGMGSRLP